MKLYQRKGTDMTKANEKRVTAPIRSGVPENVEKQSFSKKIRKKFRLFSVRSGLDMPFLFLTLTLVVIGLIMLF